MAAARRRLAKDSAGEPVGRPLTFPHWAMIQSLIRVSISAAKAATVMGVYHSSLAAVVAGATAAIRLFASLARSSARCATV
jgi:hypothetical protein